MSNVIYVGSRPGQGTAELLDDSGTGLVGATLRWKRYRSWTSTRPPCRCELCGAQFTEGGSPGLNSGYSIIGGGPAGQDDYRWICAICYDLERDHFCWTVLDTRDEACEPRDLIDAAFGWMALTALAPDDQADGGAYGGA